MRCSNYILNETKIEASVPIIEKIFKVEQIRYSDLISLTSLQVGLGRTKSNVSPGIDGEVKSDITVGRLQKLHLELAAHTYSPTPSKRVAIPKPDGGVRYLGIASQIDKVVQGAILAKLEPILENIFSARSFGSRPGKSCHSALKEIKYGWKGVTWIINVDITKCFDKLQHDRLIMLCTEFCDQAVVELIRKLLKVGYVDIHNLNDRAKYMVEGIPQGSMISPILSNLYLHELDEFFEKELKPAYNKGTERKRDPEYAKRYQLDSQEKEFLQRYPDLKGGLKKIKHNEFVVSGRFSATDGQDPNYRRLHYVRYVDDFMLGFIGPKSEADKLMSLIKEKLTSMGLEANEEKSSVVHSEELGIKYLGMYLRYYHSNKIVRKNIEPTETSVDKTVVGLRAQAVNTVHFRAPIDRMLKRLVERGLAKANTDGTIRGTAYLKISLLSDADVVKRFNAIMRGLLNYYSCINHRSDLWKVLSILRKSCALTLAHKHSLSSAARAFAKFGPALTIRNAVGVEIASLTYPKTLKTNIDFKCSSNDIKVGISPSIIDIELDKVPGSTKTNIKTALVCEYDGCDVSSNLEAHHLNPMANINKRKDLSAFEKALVARKRKVVMVCKKHHGLLHRKGLFTKEKSGVKAPSAKTGRSGTDPKQKGGTESTTE